MKPTERGTGSARSKKKLGTLALATMIYFMVSGGPYGLEDIISRSGYLGAFVILALTPIIWSLPTAFVVSELACALPTEGGFYIWVRRGLGRFWGFMEAWLSLTGSIFDMAIYPTLFVGYLGHFAPTITQGYRGWLIGIGLIIACTLWNLAGAKAVGGSSIFLGVLLLGPFVVLTICAIWHHSVNGFAHSTPLRNVDILGGILIAMWNYMGWDNSSTIASDVENPQRTYPRAVFDAVALVAASYLIPIGAVAFTGIDPNAWLTGGWAEIARAVFAKGTAHSGWIEVARRLAGEGLAIAITVGGLVGATGTFNSLTLSLSRLPAAMAKDGFLPNIFMRRLKNGVPWVALTACAIVWACCLKLSFLELVVVDVLLTGLSILLEFAALVAIRWKEPELVAPYRLGPKSPWWIVFIGLPPAALIALTVIRNSSERLGPISALTFGFGIIGLGVIVYALSRLAAKKRRGLEDI